MRTLVTGGAGFIGSHVVDRYLQAGHDVVVVDDLSTGRRDNLNPNARFHEVDICTDAFDEVFQQERPDVVCHLAAQINVTRSVEEPVLDAKVNVLGLIRLLQLAVANETKRIIFSSTGGAIYGAFKDFPATEATPPEPLSPYAVSKFAGEEYLRMYTRMYGLTHVILRYTNVFGPRQVAHGECGVCAVLTELMMQGKQPTLYGFGEPIRDYVYVGDVAEANLLALDAGDNECLNICSGRPTTVVEVFEAVKEAIGFDQEPLLKPLRPGEVEKSLADNTRARSVLGWEPRVGLREGLAETVKAFRGKKGPSA